MKALKYFVLTAIIFLGCKGGEVYQTGFPSDKMMTDGIVNKPFSSLEDILFAEEVIGLNIATIKDFNALSGVSYFEIQRGIRIEFETTQAFLFTDEDGQLVQVILIAHNGADINLDLGYVPEEYFFVSEFPWGSDYQVNIGYSSNNVDIFASVYDRLSMTSNDQFSYEFNNITARAYESENPTGSEDVIISGYIAN